MKDPEEESLEVKKRATSQGRNGRANGKGNGNDQPFSLEELEGFQQRIQERLKENPGDKALKEKLRKVNEKIEEVSDSPLVNPWH